MVLQNKQLNLICNYINDKFEGKFITYIISGYLLIVFNYKNKQLKKYKKNIL